MLRDPKRKCQGHNGFGESNSMAFKINSYTDLFLIHNLAECKFCFRKYAEFPVISTRIF